MNNMKLEELRAERAASNMKREAIVEIFNMLFDADPDNVDFQISKAHGAIGRDTARLADTFVLDAPKDPTPEFTKAQKEVADFLTDMAEKIRVVYEEKIKEITELNRQ